MAGGAWCLIQPATSSRPTISSGQAIRSTGQRTRWRFRTRSTGARAAVPAFLLIAPIRKGDSGAATTPTSLGRTTWARIQSCLTIRQNRATGRNAPIKTARPQQPDRTPREKGAPTALDGLLVVDFTRVVAGPACTQTLADFGATVIKIENPEGGDDSRHYEHADLAGESAAFISLNRNKRGIALDFTNPRALEVARALIATADVVVEN